MKDEVWNHVIVRGLPPTATSSAFRREISSTSLQLRSTLSLTPLLELVESKGVLPLKVYEVQDIYGIWYVKVGGKEDVEKLRGAGVSELTVGPPFLTK